MIASSKSSSSAPSSPLISSSRLATLRAYSCDACSAMLLGTLSGAAIDHGAVGRVGLPRPVSSQLPPASPARSTITLPGFMRVDGLRGDELRRRAAGHERGGDDDVGARDLRGERLALGLLLLLRQLARVAAGRLRVGRALDLQEPRAERLRPAP